MTTYHGPRCIPITHRRSLLYLPACYLSLCISSLSIITDSLSTLSLGSDASILRVPPCLSDTLYTTLIAILSRSTHACLFIHYIDTHATLSSLRSSLPRGTKSDIEEAPVSVAPTLRRKRSLPRPPIYTLEPRRDAHRSSDSYAIQTGVLVEPSNSNINAHLCRRGVCPRFRSRRDRFTYDSP